MKFNSSRWTRSAEAEGLSIFDMKGAMSAIQDVRFVLLVLCFCRIMLLRSSCVIHRRQCLLVSSYSIVELPAYVRNSILMKMKRTINMCRTGYSFGSR